MFTLLYQTSIEMTDRSYEIVGELQTSLGFPVVMDNALFQNKDEGYTGVKVSYTYTNRRGAACSDATHLMIFDDLSTVHVASSSAPDYALTALIRRVQVALRPLKRRAYVALHPLKGVDA